jgi:hypothetical protein
MLVVMMVCLRTRRESGRWEGWACLADVGEWLHLQARILLQSFLIGLSLTPRFRRLAFTSITIPFRNIEKRGRYAGLERSAICTRLSGARRGW